MSLRLAIPCRVALQHCSTPLRQPNSILHQTASAANAFFTWRRARNTVPDDRLARKVRLLDESMWPELLIVADHSEAVLVKLKGLLALAVKVKVGIQ